MELEPSMYALSHESLKLAYTIFYKYIFSPVGKANREKPRKHTHTLVNCVKYLSICVSNRMSRNIFGKSLLQNAGFGYALYN